MKDKNDLNKWWENSIIDMKPGEIKFRGEHIHFGTDKFPDWKTVVCYLKQRKGELPVG